MPGLLRGMARTAAIAGTATAVSNNVSRRQARKWNEEAQQAEPAAPVAAQDDSYAEIEKLAGLRDKGILTQEEFDAKKRQILGI
jgi:membrane protease subunit (stomatin/prohibitin family)